MQQVGDLSENDPEPSSVVSRTNQQVDVRFDELADCCGAQKGFNLNYGHALGAGGATELTSQARASARAKP